MKTLSLTQDQVELLLHYLRLVASLQILPADGVKIQEIIDLLQNPEKEKVHTISNGLIEDIPGLVMKEIPAGEFLMGSPDDEVDRFNDEGPQHLVKVPAFLMSQYPITQAQWRFVVTSLAKVERNLETDPSYFEGDDLPVERVSWDDAVEFCKRLSAYTKREYRLPTEAQWEYACRAGTITRYSFGDSLNEGHANFDANVDKTTPVGQYPANAFGLCDMHGNVWERCLDYWHENYEGAPDDGSAWEEDYDPNAQMARGGAYFDYSWLEKPDPRRKRIIRGGSWLSIPRHCRSASRDDFTPAVRHFGIGFRVVCSLPRIFS